MKAPHLKQPRHRQPRLLTWLTVLLATTRKGGTDWLCWVCRRPARCRVSSSNWNTLMGPCTPPRAAAHAGQTSGSPYNLYSWWEGLSLPAGTCPHEAASRQTHHEFWVSP